MNWKCTRVFFAIIAIGAGAPAQDAPEDHSVEKVLASLRVADPSLVVECAAQEPDVVDPVAVTWDEDGRMYVVEMRDYPTGPPGGTIRRLTDEDGDGRYENATVFADNLSFPNSALAYDGGLFVTAAPDIWFLKDTSGDGVADERRVVLTGFGEGNQQLRINGLFWGLDNWIYAANGRSDGAVRRPNDAPEAAISLRHHDFRFKPDLSAIEAVSGFSQFGICQDDWGNRFLSWNTIPIRHVVLEERYLTRNPHLPATATEAAIARNDGRIYPMVPNQQRFNAESIEYWNASCGLTVYRGDAMPEYRGDAFVCESVTSLVHRMKLTPDGATFVARRADRDREFLASTDLWFRAVNLATGPDGALYVVDFAREWTEHPDFVPEEMRAQVNWRNGDTLGRIWRVRPKSWPQDAYTVPKLSAMTPEELTTLLTDENGWVRMQAQRLLVERKAADAAPALRDIARGAQMPQGRLHALWTLDGIGTLDNETLAVALRDPDPRVRRQAVLLCEPRAADPQIADALAAAAQDADAGVALQLAATAGALPTKERLAICLDVADRMGDDPWVRLAVLGSVALDSSDFLQALLERHRGDVDGYAFARFELLRELCRVIGASNHADAILGALVLVAEQEPLTAGPDLAMLSGLSEGLARTKKPLRQWLAEPAPPLTPEHVKTLERAFGSAEYVANRDGAQERLRRAAVLVLAQRPDGTGVEKAKAMLAGSTSNAVRDAALEALVNGGDHQVTASLLSEWRSLTVAARRTLVTTLLSSADTAALLVDAIESGTPAPLEIDLAARETLKQYPVPEVKLRAEQLFASSGSSEKQELIARYRPALDLTGDKARGAAIFAMNCMPCHQVQGLGQHVGPDLSGIGSKPREQLLHDILDPSAEISPDFVNYTVSTVDLEVFNGVLGGETAASVTIRQAAGIEVTVLRENIEEMTVSTQSLMPQGLEAAFDVQGMADLLAFLQHSDRATLETAIANTRPPE